MAERQAQPTLILADAPLDHAVDNAGSGA
jgi:hypothetical protein